MNDKFLLRPKLINDLRIHQPRSSIENVYDINKELNLIGSRYAAKLREFKFFIQGNYVFNVHLTPALLSGKIIFDVENKYNQAGLGFQDVEIGVDPSIFNKLSYEEKSSFIVKLYTKVLEKVNTKYKLDLSILKQVESLVLKYGEDLEIIYKIKETQKYKIIITYKVSLSDEPKAFLEYIDQIDNKKSFKVVIPIKSYFDIYPLVGSIHLKGNTIVLRTRKSVISSYLTKIYQFPIKISAEIYDVILEN